MLEKIGIFILGFDIDLLYENQSVNNINNNSISMIEKTNSYLNSVKNTILLLKFLRDTLNENYRFYETELYYIKSPTNKNGNLKTFKDFAENYKNSIDSSNINSESNKSSCNSNSLNHSQEIINHNVINVNNETNNVHSLSIAHSNSSNFLFNLNKKNIHNNLTIIKELENNK